MLWASETLHKISNELSNLKGSQVGWETHPIKYFKFSDRKSVNLITILPKVLLLLRVHFPLMEIQLEVSNRIIFRMYASAI